MIGIVAYTAKPFKGIHTLAERYKKLLPNCEIISADDPSSPYHVKQIETINSVFNTLIFIEHYFDLNLVMQFKGKIFLVPMWEYLSRAAPMFGKLSGTICHSDKTRSLASQMIKCNHHLIHYPVIRMEYQSPIENIESFFMINGHPAKGRKRVDLLDEANKDDKYKVNILTVKQMDSIYPHLHVKEGFVEKKEDLYKNGQMQLYPSTLEGLGMAVYEAMEYGVPTVVVDTPPINEGYHKSLLVRPTAQSIREKMDYFYGKDTKELKEWMSEFISRRSGENFVSKVMNII